LHVLGAVIEAVLFLFLALMFVRMILSWVQMFARSWMPHGILLVLLEGVYTITDPPIRAMRRLVPPLRLGQVAFDLAFFLVFIIVIILRQLNAAFLLSA
jgi:YggT family protein